MNPIVGDMFVQLVVWRTTNLEVVGSSLIIGGMFVQLVVWRTTNLEVVGLNPIVGDVCTVGSVEDYQSRGCGFKSHYRRHVSTVGSVEDHQCKVVSLKSIVECMLIQVIVYWTSNQGMGHISTALSPINYRTNAK